MIEENFNKLWDNYLVNVQSKMFILNVQRQCEISSLITIYHKETLSDLYKKVEYHFNTKFHELSIYLNNNSLTVIPSTNETIKNFINNNLNVISLYEIYTAKYPVVFNVHLDDNCNCYFCKNT